MEINVRDDKKLVNVWLTNGEKNDPQIQAQLRELYAKYKEKKYLVAVYQSGSRDLYESTLALLAYNKKRVAELDVQREKRRRAATVER
ncbi:MAG: hypothetical protein LUH09_00620 [Clostridiales bacterium]|nr:hypothetical protein [Clostridiales bacterium]